MSTTRQFPVLWRGHSLTVPWDFLAPHEAQAKRNHSQSLEELARRGGLGPDEMLDIVCGHKWSTCHDNGMTESEAWAQIEFMVKQHNGGGANG